MDLSSLVASLSEDAIVQAVESFGAQEHRRSDRHIWFTTVCHGGDSSKLCYNRDSKTFYCYTNCGFMTFPAFLQHALGGSFRQALAYLRSMSRVGIKESVETEDEELSELQEMVQLLHRPSETFQFEGIDSYILDCFESDVFYDGWLEEGISAETMQTFGIRWDELGKSVIIPHYDINGQLVGVRTRQIEATKSKYMPLILDGMIFSHPLGMNLYGAHLHKDAIRRSKQVIVVESEKSVMKHHDWYGMDSNAVAVCGFNISHQQRRLLLQMGIEEVVLAFDKDVEMNITEDELTSDYEHYCEMVNRMGKALAPYCRVTALVDMDDRLRMKDAPLDQGQEVFLELMANRQEIVC